MTLSGRFTRAFLAIVLLGPVSKAYLELAGGDHLCVETDNGNKAIQGKYAVAWVKRFVDEDVRYSPFLCGAPHEADLRGSAVSAYRENCPY
jgi:triacylglycerol lipase